MHSYRNTRETALNPTSWLHLARVMGTAVIPRMRMAQWIMSEITTAMYGEKPKLKQLNTDLP